MKPLRYSPMEAKKFSRPRRRYSIPSSSTSKVRRLRRREPFTIAPGLMQMSRWLCDADDGGLVVDFSGSSPQAESGFINSTLTHTRSAVTAALADLTPAVANSGLLRSVVIDAPEASIVNCDYPLATAWSPYHPARLINTMIKESLDGRLPSGVGKAPPEVRMPTVRIDGCREGSCPF